MAHFTKVTMNLTDRDVSNTEELTKVLHTRSKAEAVSQALSLTSLLVKRISEGDELLVRTKNGELKKVLIPGLE